MSIPIDCPKCGVMIGEVSGLSAKGLFFKNFPSIDSGSCNHRKSVKTEKRGLLGLIKEVLVEYPETETCSAFAEYVGPSNKLMLWIAIVFCGYHGVVVNGKWAWWDFKIGFYGQGVDELMDMRHRVLHARAQRPEK